MPETVDMKLQKTDAPATHLSDAVRKPSDVVPDAFAKLEAERVAKLLEQAAKLKQYKNADGHRFISTIYSDRPGYSLPNH